MKVVLSNEGERKVLGFSDQEQVAIAPNVAFLADSNTQMLPFFRQLSERKTLSELKEGAAKCVKDLGMLFNRMTTPETVQDFSSSAVKLLKSIRKQHAKVPFSGFEIETLREAIKILIKTPNVHAKSGLCSIANCDKDGVDCHAIIEGVKETMTFLKSLETRKVQLADANLSDFIEAKIVKHPERTIVRADDYVKNLNTLFSQMTTPTAISEKAESITNLLQEISEYVSKNIPPKQELQDLKDAITELVRKPMCLEMPGTHFNFVKSIFEYGKNFTACGTICQKVDSVLKTLTALEKTIEMREYEQDFKALNGLSTKMTSPQEIEKQVVEMVNLLHRIRGHAKNDAISAPQIQNLNQFILNWIKAQNVQIKNGVFRSILDLQRDNLNCMAIFKTAMEVVYALNSLPEAGPPVQEPRLNVTNERKVREKLKYAKLKRYDAARKRKANNAPTGKVNEALEKKVNNAPIVKVN
jgi:hypothetical protein